MLLLLPPLLACSGPAPSDDTVEPDPTDTAPPTGATGPTADTGLVLPWYGLLGTPPDEDVPPATDFEVLDADDVPKGPSDVYAGVPTVLYLGDELGDSPTDNILDRLDGLVADFDALGVRVLAVNRNDSTHQLRERRASDPLGYDLWTDAIGEEFVLYYGTEISHFRLLRPNGHVLLEYVTTEQTNPNLAPEQILEDCRLLWGP